MNKISYNLILQQSETDVNTLVPSKDDADKVLAILKKIEYIDLTNGKYIPKKAFYDKNTDKIYIGIAGSNEPKAIDTTRSSVKSVERFKLPKHLINFFVKDTEIANVSKEILDLREEYFKELAEKEAQPGGCSSCKKNQLIRAYANKLLALIQ